MEKTIVMPRLMGEQWLEALRSGKYEKGKNNLQVDNEDGTASYCCLGVLQMVVDGKVQRSLTNHYNMVPGVEWCERNKIKFGPTATETRCVPSVYYLERLQPVSTVNDETDATFVEIADLLEQRMELT